MAGFRSLLAPWIGGAGSASAPAPAVGQRSLLAPWVGGAASPVEPAPADQGYRSLLAWWVGGAAALAATPPEPEPGGGFVRRVSVRRPASPDDEDDLLLAICGALCAGGLIH